MQSPLFEKQNNKNEPRTDGNPSRSNFKSRISARSSAEDESEYLGRWNIRRLEVG